MSLSKKSISLSLTVLFITGTAFSSVACNNNGDVLSKFNGGTVVRGDIRMYHDIFQKPAGVDPAETTTVAAQKQLVEGLSILKISAEEARKQGIDKDPEFIRATQLLSPWAESMAVDTYLRSQSGNHKYRMILLQGLWLTDKKEGQVNPNVPMENSKLRQTEAEEMIKKLSSMSDSQSVEFIQKNSDHILYRAFGGYLDPQCASCKPTPRPDLIEAVDKAGINKFTLIEEKNGYWIIRKVEDKQIRASDLPSYFENQTRKSMRIAVKYAAALPDTDPNKERYKAYIMDDAQLEERAKEVALQYVRTENDALVRNLIEETQKKHNFKFDLKMEEAVNQNRPLAPETVLYSMGNKKYTYGDLRTELKSDKYAYTLKDELSVLRNVLIPYEILKQTPEYPKVKDGKVAKFLITLKKDEILATLYSQKKDFPEPKIDEAEVNRIYEMQKNMQFKGMLYTTARSYIIEALKQNAQKEHFTKIQDELKQKYNLVIYEDKLKSGKL